MERHALASGFVDAPVRMVVAARHDGEGLVASPTTAQSLKPNVDVRIERANRRFAQHFSRLVAENQNVARLDV